VNGKKWDRRIARARELAETYPFARQILLFYSQLTAFQKNSYLQIASGYALGSAGRTSLPAALDDIDLKHLLTRWRPFLLMIEGEAPSSLAEFSRGLKTSAPAAASALLRAAWPAHRPVTPETGGDAGEPLTVAHATPAGTAELNPFERFCAQAFLQPYAEFLADHAEAPAPPVRRPSCPYCGSSPLVGVLRPEGEGAKRSLVCSFCRTEWDYLRIACPACDERREEKLCVYTAPKFEAVRVEACGTCRAYAITVDLTKNGLAVPEVDALAAIPLTLWADENGYHKITRSVLCL
jgi:formate dehydrogenase maturation protein FdhE